MRPAQASTQNPESDLAGALHEVSNALTVVLGWVEAAQAEVTRLQQQSERLRSQGAGSQQLELSSARAQEALSVAHSHAKLGHVLARQAIGANVETETERTALQVARDALLGVRPEAERSGVLLKLEPREAEEALVDDALSVQQILTNLLLNAIAFSPRGGHVMLELQCVGGEVLFAVTDEGPGVPPEKIEELFSGPGSTRSGGAGVGLPHSHALAESKGGDLALAEVDLGSRFELRWPEAEVRSAARHRGTGAPSSLAGKRILVVEDDAAVISLLELALEARGMEVVVARSADELSEAARGCLDAALVDLSPIQSDAPRALATLRQHNHDLPVIIISGSTYGVPEVVSKDILAWVRKPFEVSEVVEALAAIG